MPAPAPTVASAPGPAPAGIALAADAVRTDAQMDFTAGTIAEVQLANGMIPWFPGGHADPWNHVEAAMALAVAGYRVEAEAAYEWLRSTQHADGSWCTYYRESGIEEARRDTNVSAYVATGTWHHFLVTGDVGFLDTMYSSVVEPALEFCLGLQQPGGEVLWALEADGIPGRFALLTGSSSLYLSLRCAMAAAERLGRERPDWELAAGRLGHAVGCRGEAFAPKHRWAMDWYYPVLTGVVTGLAARERLWARWDDFVMEGLGVRCVSDQPWVTAAETAECAMALQAAGMSCEAHRVLAWAHQLRDVDGSYWTGCVHPQEVHFPAGERSTYSAAAVILAADCLRGTGPAAGLFGGRGLPVGLDLSVPAGSAVHRSVPAGSVPAGSVPAGSVPAGSAVHRSVPAGSAVHRSVPAGSAVHRSVPQRHPAQHP